MSLVLSSLKHSKKRQGKFEKSIEEHLYEYLKSQLFIVKNHVSLNISWGNILSEIDIIGLKDDKLYVYEVKTKYDNIHHAKKQFINIKDFIDYYYIVHENDFHPNNYDNRIGFIKINEDKKISIKEATLIDDEISEKNLLKLKKSDLCKIGNLSQYVKKNKKEIVEYILAKKDAHLKREIQKVVLGL